ncbi:MAG TPA: HYR domain-containing protein [Chitinophagales bacterium]|nr:HYR domain-containing protein [Chitinophagales bacterium]
MKQLYTKFKLTWLFLLTVYCLMAIYSPKLHAQAGQCLGGGCTGPGTSYGTAQSTTSTTFVNSLSFTFGGEYNTYNVTSGQQYEWSLCTADGAVNGGGDTQLTLKTTANANLCYSDDLCGSAPKILWTATFTGQVRVLINQFNCATNSSSHTVRWRCVTCGGGGGNPCSAAINIPSAPVTNQSLSCTTAAVPGNLSATNVPTACGAASNLYKGGQEALYTFTPTTTGTYTISYSGQTWSAIFVYSGACPASGGTCVNSTGSSSSAQSLSVSLTAGIQYFIWFDTYPTPNSPCPGTFSIAAPAANPCSSITTISGCGVSTTSTHSGSGAGWSVTACGFSTPGQERVYQFTAPTTGTYQINVSSATGGFVDYFWKAASGGCNNSGWNCIDDINFTGTFNAVTPMSFTAGTTYYILLDPEGTGSYSHTFSLVCPVFDPCSSITNISGCGVSTTSTHSGSGAGWNVTACGFSTPGQERVYQFTAPTTGTYQLNVSSATGGYVDYFWKAASGGCNNSGWNCIDDINFTGTFNAVTPMSFTAGTTYYILLDPEGTGSYSHTFSLVCPVFDPCSSITNISGCGVSTTSTHSGSGAGWNVTACGFSTPGQERIYQFTAPTTGTYQLNVSSATGGYVDYFWKAASGGCNSSGWNCIDDIFSAGTYNAVTPMSFTAGTTYYILLDPEGTGSYSHTFSLVCPVTPAYRASFISMNTGSSTWCAGETRTVSVTVQNTGTNTWTNSLPDVNIGVKWNAEADYFVRVDANGLAPNATQTYNLTITAPNTPGTNNLTFDVVVEGQCWFGNNNGGCGPGNATYVSSPITINASPTVSAGSGGSICAGESFQLNGSATGGAPGTLVITISGASWLDETTWTLTNSLSQLVSSGGPYSSGSTNPTTLTPSNPPFTFFLETQGFAGDNVANYTITCNGSTIHSGTVFANSSTTIPNINCGGGGGAITYSWSPTTNLSNPNIANPVATPSATTTYTLTATQGGCSATSQVTVTVNPPTAAPTNVTATPSTVCTPTTVQLNATSAGNTITWYTDPTGGTPIGTSASGANFGVNPSSTTTYYAEAAQSAPPGSQTFNFTGSVQTFTVPTGVTSINVDARGAQGGFGSPATHRGGFGGRAVGTIAVTPGQVLQIYVGGVGANANGSTAAAGGYNGGGNGAVWAGNYGGGGGGGASDIRVSPYAAANRLAVAGGGGGGGYNYGTTDYDRGGAGGGLTGETGYGGNVLGGQGAGTGGTQSAGGTGGTFSGYCTASNGTLSTGGNGGTCTNGGGGGGGGYYGGGGATWSGGGGGSNYLPGGTHTQGFQTGNGQVIISWSGGSSCPSTRVPVTVTYGDTQDPTITCPSNISTANTPTFCGAYINYISPTGTDNCPNPTTLQIGGIASGSFFPIGPTTNTFQVTDGSGRTATCSFTVNITDAQPPLANCQNVSVSIGTGGTATVTAAQINNSSTDNCSVSSVSIHAGNTNYTCSNIGSVVTVTLRVNDAAGNSSTCNAQVSINDANGNCCNAPVAQCLAVPSINLNMSGMATLTASNVDNGSTAGCGLQSITVSPQNFNCSHVGTPQTVTLTVTDIFNKTSTCQTNLTVIDNTPPTVTCQNTSVNLSGSSASILPSDVYASGNDNCTSVTLLSVTPSSFTCNNVGANTVTLLATDGNGNTATCSANVQVNDVTQPNVFCKNITVQLTGTSVDITPADVYDSGSDNCGAIILQSVSPSTLTCANLGFVQVTLTVNDGNGNTASCNAIVNVQDATPPTFSYCPDDVYVDADEYCIAIATWTEPTINDNCSATVQQTDGSPNGDYFGFGETTITYVATDAGNNTAGCTFTVHVQDNTAPTVFCLPTVDVYLTTGSVDIDPAALFFFGNDNCGNVNPVSASPAALTCADLGSPVTVTLTADDGYGNTSTCTAQVTLIDDNDPVAACKNITVVLDETGSASIDASEIDDSSYDYCNPNISLDADVTEFTCANVGTVTVTLTVTNYNNRTAACTAEVLVRDEEAPVAKCPNSFAQTADAGQCGAVVEFTISPPSDNCASSSQCDFASGSTFAVGQTTLTVTATDDAGNTGTCSFTITVTDNEAPTANCPNSFAQTADAGQCGAVVSFTIPAPDDNCGATSEADITSGSTFAVGENTVTVTATDDAGNTGVCSFTITVTDNEAPTANCPNSFAQTADAGQCGAVVSFTIPAPDDNCGATSEADITSGSTFAVGENTVTVTATDDAGNTGVCSFTITVTDNEAPTANCPNSFAQTADAGQCGAVVSFTIPAPDDNCGATSEADITSGSTFAVGETTLTVTATDDAGNTGTCSFTITVTDNEAPTAYCPNSFAQTADAGQCSTSVSFTILAPDDNCGATSEADITSGSTFNVGETTVTVTATDDAGNTGTCSFTITVTDDEAPTAYCPNSFAQTADAGQCGAVVSFTIPAPDDNCGATSEANLTSGSTFAVGENTVTVTATDDAGNTGTCSFTVNISDDQLPQAICTSISVTLDENGTATITPEDIGSDSSDNCDFDMELSQTQFDCTNQGENTVTLTVTDASNNSAACTATVTVELPYTAQITPNGSTSLCAGESVTLDAGNYSSYQWNDTGGFSTDQAITVSEGGMYAVTVTDANGCTSEASIEVQVNALPSPGITSSSGNTTFCSNVGEVLDAGEFTAYQWNELANSAITRFIQPTQSGTYSVTVTNEYGCTGTSSISVTVIQAPNVVITNNPNNTVCQGGVIYIIATGGNQYQWSGPNGYTATSGSIMREGANLTMAGVYTVTVTDNSGCVAIANTLINVIDATPATISGATTVCEGNTISLTASSGVFYQWVGPGGFSSTTQTMTQSNANTAMAGTYSVTVTDAGGCTSVASASVAVTPFMVSITGSNGFCTTDAIVLSTTGGGNYLWSGPNGFSSSDATISISNPSAAEAGVYTVTVTSTQGCSASASKTVAVNSNPEPLITGATGVCAGGTISLFASGGNTYTWSGPNGYSTTGFTVHRTGATVAMSGTYTVTVSNANGCTGVTSVDVTVHPLPVAAISGNSAFCVGSTISLMASGGISYAWSGPGGFTAATATITRPGATTSMAGTYTVTVTGAGGCTAIASRTITVSSSSVTASITGGTTACMGNSFTLTASGGGTGGSYAWGGPNGFTADGAVLTRSGLTADMAGLYTVTVTNAGGCTASASRTITINPTPTASISGNTSVCVGKVISLIATGGNSYAWSGPNGFTSTSSSVMRSGATTAMQGTYTVTVTANGCSATASVYVTVNTNPTASITGPTSVCVNGSFTFTAPVGGTWYAWSGPNGFTSSGTTNSITRSPVTTTMAGTYTVTVTNAGGCTATASRSITTTAAPNANITGSSTLCAGATITLTASGGTAYSWSGPNGYTATGSTISRPSSTTAMSGVYTVTVSNSSGCTSSASRTVTVNSCKNAGDDSNLTFETLLVAPNPTHAQTAISFTSVESEYLKLSVYAIDGREVGMLFDGMTETGKDYQFLFDMDLLPTGTYFVVLRKADGSSKQLPVLLIR